MERLARLGFAPRAILDLGAYRGQWTALARTVFPNAEYTLVDAITCVVASARARRVGGGWQGRGQGEAGRAGRGGARWRTPRVRP